MMEGYKEFELLKDDSRQLSNISVERIAYKNDGEQFNTYYIYL